MRLGQDARRRIESRYDLAAVARQYEDLYEHLLDWRAVRSSPPAIASVPGRATTELETASN